jgi:hypothetical protein
MTVNGEPVVLTNDGTDDETFFNLGNTPLVIKGFRPGKNQSFRMTTKEQRARAPGGPKPISILLEPFERIQAKPAVPPWATSMRDFGDVQRGLDPFNKPVYRSISTPSKPFAEPGHVETVRGGFDVVGVSPEASADRFRPVTDQDGRPIKTALRVCLMSTGPDEALLEEFQMLYRRAQVEANLTRIRALKAQIQALEHENSQLS